MDGSPDPSVSRPVRIFSAMIARAGRLWRAVPTYSIEIPRSRLVAALATLENPRRFLGYLIYIEPGAYDVSSMETITLEINGETREITPVPNVRALLETLGISGSHVAVEVNRKIIRRGEWEQTPISNLDRVEIVQFVGGG